GVSDFSTIARVRDTPRLSCDPGNSCFKVTICGTGKDNLTKPVKKRQGPDFRTDNLNCIVLVEHQAPSQTQIGLAAQNDFHAARFEKSEAAKSSEIARQE